MFEVHRSNRADPLVALLARRLADAPLPDPMAAEQIAVHSRGMERWLSHQLAERLGARRGNDGICANVDFPFPARVIGSVLDACLGEDPGPDPWRPDRLVWPILTELAVPDDDPAFAQIRRYVGDHGAVDRRRYGLARRIADLFDRYAMFRPEMVARWDVGDDVDADGEALPDRLAWQPQLWRRLTRRLDRPHLAARFAAAVEMLGDDAPPTGLPDRVTFFGTSALPPAYLELLAALGRHVDVGLYVVVPSDRLWARVHAAAGRPAAAPVDPAHPLLASCGRLARDVQTVLESTAPDVAGESRFAVPPEPTSLLSRLQADLVADAHRGGIVPTADGTAHPDPVTLADGDRSIELHACHSPARQVEVLHDVLLRCFEDDPSLQPRDVLVVTPDIETYAPLVSAVFDRPGDTSCRAEPGRRVIPYRLADRTLRHTNPVAAAVLAVLDLAAGRAEASAVLDLLARRPVRRRFGIDEDEVGRLHGWVADCGIRWGVDGDHRERHGQPDGRDHTWQFGLDRLLLGVAMADEDDRVVGDVAPYDDIEGGDVELLDRLVAFRDVLFDLAGRLVAPRPVDAWADAVTEITDRLVDDGDHDDRYLAQFRRAVADLVDTARRPDGAPSSERLTLDAIGALLADAGEDRGLTDGYERGAVTFCAMIPMRSIPHRVVVVLGADDGAFPRPLRPLGFDLIAAAPRLGDRDPRDEDRLLFLEALLAAEDRFVITWTGRDQRTNEPRAPAVPVGELLDVLDRAVVEDGDGRTARQRLIVEHPLQAFSPRAFGADGDGPASYDLGQLAAARQLRDGRVVPWNFVPERLPPPDDDTPGVVQLGDLRRFFADPTRWLFTHRIGTWLRESYEQVEDLEPVTASNLERWALGQSLLEARMAGRADGAWEHATLARGRNPTGVLGRYEIDGIRPTVEALVARLDVPADPGVRPDLADRTSLPIDVAVGEDRLVGLVTGLRDGVLVRAQYSRLKPKHRLELWLTHLALAAMYPDNGLRCVLVGRGETSDAATFTFRPLAPDVAAGHLQALIGLYRQGRCEPLPLFASSSAVYAEKIIAAEDAGTPDDTTAAVKAARRAWEPNHQGWGGDRVEDHVAQCYGDDCDFDTILADTDFADVALTVWRPVLAAEEAS